MLFEIQKVTREIIGKILIFIKQETVLSIAGILAILSMFVIPPTKQYIGYFDFRVLSLLFCLMIVVAGLRNIGVFEKMLQYLLQLVHNTRQLAFTLVFASFITSMWITNDVALITFVPFAIAVLHKIKKDHLILYIVVMQTVAANLGSMCTPIGNPQNLYLYSVSGLSIESFFKLMLPYTMISFILIGFSLLLVKRETIAYDRTSQMDRTEVFTFTQTKLVAFLVLFVFCILTVLRILDYRLTLAIVIVAVFLLEKRLIYEADYLLLLTFVAFFIFVGNIKNIEVVGHLLAQCVSGNEILISVVASQFISNVPAAVLLSGFTNQYTGLMVGTNIGGLGTLIASMASLISFRFYSYTAECNRKKYIGVFTLVNFIFLIVLMIAAYLFW